jgi:hypothetical protein
MADYFREAESSGSRLELLHALDSVDIILLLPAIAPGRAQGATRDLFRILAPLTPQQATFKAEHLKIFNISSKRDWANRILFPTSELFSLRAPRCSIGACGENEFKDLDVNDAGHVIDPRVESTFRVWNVRAEKVISSHSDIYKGRIAELIWQLIEEVK